jgi:hypothetical protein
MLLVVVFGAWSIARNRVVVVNESGQRVHSLVVEVCGKTIRLGDIPPGGSACAAFGTPVDESHFELRGRLEDGTEVNDSGGYVVWEDYGRRFVIVIGPRADVSYYSK